MLKHRLETQFEEHSHIPYLNKHLLNTHYEPGTMLGTAELKKKLLSCWQLIAPRTLGSFHSYSNTTHSACRPQPGLSVTPWEPCVALRKGKQAQTLHPGIAPASSQQSIPRGTTGNSKLSCPQSQPLPHQGFLREVNHIGIHRNPWPLPESRPLAALQSSPQGKASTLAHVTPLIIPCAWSPTITEHLS